jgi:hypothetical protein
VIRGLIDAGQRVPLRSGQGIPLRRGDRVVIRSEPADPRGDGAATVPGLDALAQGAPHLEILIHPEHAAVDGVAPLLEVPAGVAGILLEVVEPPGYGAGVAAGRVVIEEGSWRGRQVWLSLAHIGRLPAASGSLSELYQEELRRTVERRQAREAQRVETRRPVGTTPRTASTPAAQPLLGPTSRPANAHLETAPPSQAQTPPKPAENEVLSICGAPTRSGAPCQRKVKGGGRCYQHR